MLIYLIIVIISAIIRLPLARLLCNVYNSGSEWYYTPGILKEHSVAYETGQYYSHNRRVRNATWLFYPLIPIYWFVQALHIIRILFCLLEDYLSYGAYEKKLLTQTPEYFPGYYRR